MNRDELEKRNVGENLDSLMNLDPRGYGVCRILYAGSRKVTGEPLTMHAAQKLADTVKPGDLVYILTGFVLLPHKVPEMDGMVSSMLFARALVLAFDAKPIIICPEDSVQAIRSCACVVGLHVYEDIDAVREMPMTVSIGDLGNEIGMGKIAEHIRTYVPFTDKGECSCCCRGGILAASTTDCIITATCSDWGCYGLMAAIAYLKRDIDILQTEEMEAELMRAAARCGLIDMTGSLLPGIDGFDTKLNVSILSLMRQCTDYALRYSHNSERWFAPVLEKKFFD